MPCFFLQNHSRKDMRTNSLDHWSYKWCCHPSTFWRLHHLSIQLGHGRIQILNLQKCQVCFCTHATHLRAHQGKQICKDEGSNASLPLYSPTDAVCVWERVCVSLSRSLFLSLSLSDWILLSLSPVLFSLSLSPLSLSLPRHQCTVLFTPCVAPFPLALLFLILSPPPHLKTALLLSSYCRVQNIFWVIFQHRLLICACGDRDIQCWHMCCLLTRACWLRWHVCPAYMIPKCATWHTGAMS